jgi:hypothetical protein
MQSLNQLSGSVIPAAKKSSHNMGSLFLKSHQVQKTLNEFTDYGCEYDYPTSRDLFWVSCNPEWSDLYFSDV